jgi:hypothetical protein
MEHVMLLSCTRNKVKKEDLVISGQVVTNLEVAFQLEFAHCQQCELVTHASRYICMYVCMVGDNLKSITLHMWVFGHGWKIVLFVGVWALLYSLR